MKDENTQVNKAGRQIIMHHLKLVRSRLQPRLRSEYSVKRDMKKAGEEEDWKKRTRDRGGWKRLSYEAVKKLLAAPHL